MLGRQQRMAGAKDVAAAAEEYEFLLDSVATSMDSLPASSVYAVQTSL